MKKILLLLAFFTISAGAFAQIETPVKWAYAAKKINSKEAVVFFKATIQPGWHIYSQNVKDGGPIKTSFVFKKATGYTPVGKTTEPTPITRYEDTFKMNVSFFEKTATFQQKVKLTSANATTVTGTLEYMTCNDKKCLPPETVDFSIPIR